MTRSLLAFALAAVLAVPAAAGPIQADSVAAGAKWIVHFDMEGFSASQVGAAIVEKARSGKGAEKLDWVARNVGVDLTRDIAAITLYGTNYEPGQGVAILRGRFNEQSMVGLVEANPSHQEIAHGDRIIHTWTDDKRGTPASGSFYAPGVLIMASSIEDVRQATDVLNGAVAAAAAADLPAASSGAFLTVSAEEHNGRIGRHAKAAIMQNASRLSLTAGETGGKMRIEATVGAATDEHATQIEQILNGMRAFMLLSGEGNPAAAEFAQAVAIARDGANVALTAAMAPDRITEVMESLGQPKHHRRTQTAE